MVTRGAYFHLFGNVNEAEQKNDWELKVYSSILVETRSGFSFVSFFHSFFLFSFVELKILCVKFEFARVEYQLIGISFGILRWQEGLSIRFDSYLIEIQVYNNFWLILTQTHTFTIANANTNTNSMRAPHGR